ncbi:MAG: NAD(P) transhydrogenase subunit alpha [Chloroflexota bacterium]
MILFVQNPTDKSERRTPLTPAAAKKLTGLGISIEAPSGIGEKSGHIDQEYIDEGVSIVEDVATSIAKADLVFGLEIPKSTYFKKMKAGSTFLGRIDPFNNKRLINAAAKADVRLISMEMVPRTTLAQKMDVLSSQANLAGYQAVITGAAKLDKILPMMMTPAGTISPSKVFIVGVGVAGLQAIATAKRLGARVQAFDTRPVVEEQVRSLGAKFVKIDLGETGQTDQGYATELTPEQLEMQRQGMAKVCADSDIVITTAKLFGRKAPTIITGDMVAAMSAGSVIVDLAAETGGNVEGTQLDKEVITNNGVKIIGIGRLENEIPTHASQMYAANLANFTEHFWDGEAGALNLDLEDEIVAGSLITNEGEVIHEAFK